MTTATESQPMPETPGLVFGRYQIIRRLAVGGMGEVFLGRQTGVAGFDRLVILKSLLPDLAAQEDFVNQFLDEARVAATLNHPNIVSIFEVGQWSGTYLIAMEYIHGDNLSRLQRAAERLGKRIPAEIAAYIIHDGALALDHAHKAVDLEGRWLQIVHRDVSPQNIMVRTDGVTKVVDFGIAKASNKISRTETGILKGKVQYMAPEHVQGLELDGRADQFALGVVLFEMIAGRKLFRGNNDIDILRQIAAGAIPSLSSVAPETAPQLARTVDRMLSSDRSLRYPSLLEAAADLNSYLEVAGLKHAQERTADLVRELVGEELSSKTLDLKPTASNNFVINLAQGQSSSTSVTAARQSSAAHRGVKVGVATGVGFSAALAIVTTVLMMPTGEAPSAAVQATATQPSTSQPSGSPQPLAGTGTSTSNTPPPVMAPRYLLDTVPPGAQVREGAVVLGITPLDTEQLTPGVEHKLVVSFPGYGELHVTVKLREGETYRDKLTLKALRIATADGKARPTIAEPPTASPTASSAGLLTIDTKPWTKVYIDGKYVDSTPVSKVELDVGTHNVRLVNEAAGVDTVKSVTIKAGETLKQSWVLQ